MRTKTTRFFFLRPLLALEAITHLLSFFLSFLSSARTLFTPHQLSRDLLLFLCSRDLTIFSPDARKRGTKSSMKHPLWPRPLARAALLLFLTHHAKAKKPTVVVARAAPPRGGGASSSGPSTSLPPSRVEVLKKEKELLQETLAAAAQATDQLAGALQVRQEKGDGIEKETRSWPMTKEKNGKREKRYALWQSERWKKRILIRF